MVTVALATAAPAGSTTLPSMVPAFPSDWPDTGWATSAQRRSTPRARIVFIVPVLGVSGYGPRLISPAGGISHERAGNRRERTCCPGTKSPLEDLPDLVRLALADHQLQRVAERNVPALAAERGQFADVVYIHDGVAVNPLELRPAETIDRKSTRLNS